MPHTRSCGIDLATFSGLVLYVVVIGEGLVFHSDRYGGIEKISI